MSLLADLEDFVRDHRPHGPKTGVSLAERAAAIGPARRGRQAYSAALGKAARAFVGSMSGSGACCAAAIARLGRGDNEVARREGELDPADDPMIDSETGERLVEFDDDEPDFTAEREAIIRGEHVSPSERRREARRQINARAARIHADRRQKPPAAKEPIETGRPSRECERPTCDRRVGA